MSEPEIPIKLADLSGLKVLAHPLRQRILRQLAVYGPATSTTLAKELGGTTGGTSYNLRVLADHGFIEEVPERARGRERWWRHVDTDLRMPLNSQQDEETRSTIDELHRLWFAEDAESFARFQIARSEMGDWGDALPYSRGEITVTLDELRAFFEEYLALLKRYQRPADGPSEARTVYTRFVAYPDVERSVEAAAGPTDKDRQ